MTAPPDPTPAEVPRLYLPALDGLRFLAFALVFLFHQGLPSARLRDLAGETFARAARENGWVGVQLFFILSGYLITTLLLREERAFGRVDLRAFWARRVLRIWPLYYLTVGLTFGVLPFLDGSLSTRADLLATAKHLPWFLAFLGNWSMIAQGPVSTDAQSILWSVCVEEQFYLAVPLIVAWVGSRWRVPLVATAILGAVGLRHHLAISTASQLAIQYNTFAQADTLLSGVLLALLLGHSPGEGRSRNWVRFAQWPIYALSAWVFTRPTLGHGLAWHKTWDFVAIWCVGVGIVWVAVAGPDRVRSALGYSRLVWLGKISYGLYMFHEVAFWLKDRLAAGIGWFPNDEWLWPIASLALTIGLAAGSYYGFERRFLRLKSRWSRVPSRPV